MNPDPEQPRETINHHPQHEDEALPLFVDDDDDDDRKPAARQDEEVAGLPPHDEDEDPSSASLLIAVATNEPHDDDLLLQQLQAETAVFPAVAAVLEHGSPPPMMLVPTASASITRTILPSLAPESPPNKQNHRKRGLEQRHDKSPKKQLKSSSASARPTHVHKDAQGNVKLFGSALGYLARQFMDMVLASESGIVDMGVCAKQLGVPKRRIYDITGVLEGIGYLEKRSKNCVAWKGSETLLGDTIDPAAKERIDELRAASSALALEEQRLDQWIHHLRNRTPVVAQSLSCDEIVQAIFYPRGASRIPTRESAVDASGKPKSVLISVQAPFGSLAHIVPSNDDGTPERQLYVGGREGLARYDASAPPMGTWQRHASPFSMTTGRTFKSLVRKDMSVYMLPTYFDDKEEKIKTTGIRLLSDDNDPYVEPTLLLFDDC